MIGVYYPYLENASKWDELRYSLRSLERFFKEEEYEVWIVGDKPDWIKNVRHIAHVKNHRIAASCTNDAISKLSAYLEHRDTPEKFIRMYDDIYFIGNRTVNDLEITRYLFTNDELRNGSFTSGGAVWRDQVFRTVSEVERWRACERERLREVEMEKWGEIVMTETHCPEVFEKKKLQEVFEIFDVLEDRLLTSTLYYNIFAFDRKLRDRKIERALFYGKENEFSYGELKESALAGKYFLNHNDEGLDDKLKAFIKETFQDKSRWEK